MLIKLDGYSKQKTLVVMDTGVHEELIQRDFELESLFNDLFEYELRVYTHPLSKSLIFLHRPWCVSGFSRRCMTMARRILRNLTLDAVTQLVNNLQGKTPLHKDRRWGNPLLAAYVFQMAVFLGQAC